MKKRKMIPAREVAKEWFKSKSFRKAYDALEAEFAQASAQIEARVVHVDLKPSDKNPARKKIGLSREF
jgi:hypothetical protein